MSEGQTVGVLIVPDAVAKQVRDYAEGLAEAQASEVEGYRAGFGDLGGLGNILGRPDLTLAGVVNTLSGTQCSVSTKEKDFSCLDDD